MPPQDGPTSATSNAWSHWTSKTLSKDQHHGWEPLRLKMSGLVMWIDPQGPWERPWVWSSTWLAPRSAPPHVLQVCPPQWLAPGQPAGRGEAPHNSYRWIDFLGTDLFLLRRSLNQEKLRVCPLGKDDSKTEWGASGEPGTSFLRTSRDRDRRGAPRAGGGSRAWKSQQGLEGKINWTVKKQP